MEKKIKQEEPWRRYVKYWVWGMLLFLSLTFAFLAKVCYKPIEPLFKGKEKDKEKEGNKEKEGKEVK